MKVAVTGHRPQRIVGMEQNIKRWLDQEIGRIQSCYKDVRLLCGMAQGVDQMAAMVALNRGVPIQCYFAYRHKLSAIEEYIADRAAEVRFLEDKYSVGCFTRRDRRMVRDCDLLLAVWDGKKGGGTWYTYEYAEDMQKPVILYPWIQINENIGGLPHENT